MHDNLKICIGGLETQMPNDGVAIGAVEDRQCLARNATSDPESVAGQHTNRIGCCVWVPAGEVPISAGACQKGEAVGAFGFSLSIAFPASRPVGLCRRTGGGGASTSSVRQ